MRWTSGNDGFVLNTCGYEECLRIYIGFPTHPQQEMLVLRQGLKSKAPRNKEAQLYSIKQKSGFINSGWVVASFWDQGKPVRLRNLVPAKIELQDNEGFTFPWSKKLRISVFAYTFQKPLPNSGQLHHPSYICLVSIWRLRMNWHGGSPEFSPCTWIGGVSAWLSWAPRNSQEFTLSDTANETMKRQSTHKPPFFGAVFQGVFGIRAMYTTCIPSS